MDAPANTTERWESHKYIWVFAIRQLSFGKKAELVNESSHCYIRVNAHAIVSRNESFLFMAECDSGPRGGHLVVLEHRRAVHDHIADANGKLVWFVERRLIRDRVFV